MGSLPPFRLHRPARLEEAARLLVAMGDGACAMAGGVDVINWPKAGAAFSDIVHIGRLDELRGQSLHGRTLTIGAAVTHRELERSRVVAAVAPDLAGAWAELGSVRIRCAGTVGGNLLAGEPTYDGAPILAALGARARFTNGDTAPVATIAGVPRSGVLLEAIEVECGARLSFVRRLKPIVSVAVASRLTEDRMRVTIAVGCAHPAVAVTEAELGVDETAATARRIAGELPPPLADHHASATYRRCVIEVLTRRELEAHARRWMR